MCAATVTHLVTGLDWGEIDYQQVWPGLEISQDQSNQQCSVFIEAAHSVPKRCKCFVRRREQFRDDVIRRQKSFILQDHHE